MRGASALERLIEEFPDARLRVLVVWEPVLVSDVAPPLNRVLALIHDRRAMQYWDPRRVVSRDLVRTINAAPQRYGSAEHLPEDFIVWDAVAVFGESARWERDLPVPAHHGGPVVNDIDETRRAIAETMRAP